MSTYEDDLRLTLKSEFDAGQIRDVGDAANAFEPPLCGITLQLAERVDDANDQERRRPP